MEFVYGCRSSSISLSQFMHYGQLILFNYFGEFIRNFTYPGTQIPNDFPLSNISANVTLHFSIGDSTTPQIEIAKLQSKLKSIVHTQMIEDENFGHSDFALGNTAHEIVYTNILSTWKQYSAC